jgi:hypothetical protein
MRSARVLVAGACAALTLLGCGGGASGTPPPGSASTGPIGPVDGSDAPAAVATFRACHKHRDGSLVLIMLFENRDRSLIGGFEGTLGYLVDAVEPATWTTTGDPVAVEPGYNEHVRQITVPAGERPPSQVTLSVATTAAVDETNVLATNEVTVPVPATACSAA